MDRGNVESRAVNAVAVRRGERRITYIVTNLANRATQLTLSRNGTPQRGFDVRVSGISTNTLRSISINDIEATTRTNQNTVTIPGYSVMRVEVTFDNSIAKSIGDTKDIIENTTAGLVTLYPNPTASNFNIALKGMESANIVISDLLGKVVYETTTNEKNVELQKGNTFKTGLYLVRVTDQNNKTYNNKLIIN